MKPGVSRLSGYRLMWILVLFDLPTETRAERRAATRFRTFLLDEGFERAQLSVYARFANGKEKVAVYCRRIEANMPDAGDVHILSFTDKQYENIIRLSGHSKKARQKNPDQLALF